MIQLPRTLALSAALLALAGAAQAQIGTPYCTANPNSTGQVGLLSATGSTDVTQNDLTLQASQLPPNQFCLFVTSQAQGFIPNPGGSAGNLCLGGGPGRYNGNIVSSGSTGTASLAVDLTFVPEPNGFYAVMPGMTVNFQLWHRDTPATSNFTRGLEVTFDAGSSLSYQNDIYPMFTQPNIGAPSCVTCHGFTCGLDFSTALGSYQQMVDVSAVCCGPDDYVEPGNSAQSVLYQKLQGPPSCGSQMPQGGTFAGDADMIRDWIDQGAPF